MYNLSRPAGIVDCSDDPYNLRCGVDAIMQEENFILDRLPEGQKLVVLVGDDHAMQIPVLLQHALLAAHQQQKIEQPDKSFAFGYELQHNLRYVVGFRKLAAPFYRWTMPEDPNGIHSMKALKSYLCGFASLFQTFKARNAMFDFCKGNEISVSFNDAARKMGPKQFFTGHAFLDQTDPLTRRLVEEYKPHLLGKKIPRLSRTLNMSDGLVISDRAIITNAMEHMERACAKIYIQQCGIGHLNNLSALFKAQNVAVLVVGIIPSGYEQYFAAVADQKWGENVRISGLASDDDDGTPYNTIRARVNAASGYNL